MSRSLNISSGKKAFGILNEPSNASTYIFNKKAQYSYCISSKCQKNVKVGSQSNKLLYNLSNRLTNFPDVNTINKTNLSINLITSLDLKDVPVIEDFSGNSIPTTIDINSEPYLRYNIDPSGNLFGNDSCGINNYVNYLVYDETIIT